MTPMEPHHKISAIRRLFTNSTSPLKLFVPPNVPDFSLLNLERESVLRSTEPKIHSYNNSRKLPQAFMLPPLNRERYPNTLHFTPVKVKRNGTEKEGRQEAG
jgi:hypothetical protein